MLPAGWWGARALRPLGPLAALLCVAALGCSLVLDAGVTQCRDDTGCARFPGTTCDRARHVCVAAVNHDGAAEPDGGAPSDDGGGSDLSLTLVCAPDGGTPLPPEVSGACTSATCLPFDNRARLRNLNSDGTLMPLPDPGLMRR